MITAADVYEDLLDYLQPLAGVLLDEQVSEVQINPDLRVFVERQGRRDVLPGIELQRTQVDAVARRIARSNGQELSEATPICNARLHDGSRVAILGSPVSPRGLLMVIRKFQQQFFTLDQLIEQGTLTPELAAELVALVNERKNLLISGKPGDGKTTLLTALLRFVPEDERIILIEKPNEIQLEHPNCVPLEASEEFSTRTLVKAAMRLSPDRLVVGEVRGDEALDMLQALNSGVTGSFTTIHANSALLALSKLTNYALRGASEAGEKSTVAYTPIRREIADCIHYVLQLEKRKDGRRVVEELIRVEGYDASEDQFVTEGI